MTRELYSSSSKTDDWWKEYYANLFGTLDRLPNDATNGQIVGAVNGIIDRLQKMHTIQVSSASSDSSESSDSSSSTT